MKLDPRKFASATDTLNLCPTCSAVDCQVRKIVGDMSKCPFHIHLLSPHESAIRKKVLFDGDEESAVITGRD